MYVSLQVPAQKKKRYRIDPKLTLSNANKSVLETTKNVFRM